MRKLTVIIPAFNEVQDNIDFLVAQLETMEIDYIVVDDGSDIPIKGTKVIRREKNRGYGNAIKAGIRKAKGNYIGIIDGDLQYDVVELIHLWREMKDEDMLIGKRMTTQGGFRRTMGRLIMRLIASIFTCRYIPDANSGSRIFKKKLAKCYFPILCDTFSFTTSLTVCMIIDKYKVRWRPIHFYPRKGKPSTARFLYHGLVTLYQIVWLTVGLNTRELRRRLREA